MDPSAGRVIAPRDVTACNDLREQFLARRVAEPKPTDARVVRGPSRALRRVVWGAKWDGITPAGPTIVVNPATLDDGTHTGTVTVISVDLGEVG